MFSITYETKQSFLKYLNKKWQVQVGEFCEIYAWGKWKKELGNKNLRVMERAPELGEIELWVREIELWVGRWTTWVQERAPELGECALEVNPQTTWVRECALEVGARALEVRERVPKLRDTANYCGSTYISLFVFFILVWIEKEIRYNRYIE